MPSCARPSTSPETVLEGYPMTTTSGALLEELHVGTLGTYLDAGFTEVLRPSLRRAVVRIDL